MRGGKVCVTRRRQKSVIIPTLAKTPSEPILPRGCGSLLGASLLTTFRFCRRCRRTCARTLPGPQGRTLRERDACTCCTENMNRQKINPRKIKTRFKRMVSDFSQEFCLVSDAGRGAAAKFMCVAHYFLLWRPEQILRLKTKSFPFIKQFFPSFFF